MHKTSLMRLVYHTAKPSHPARGFMAGAGRSYKGVSSPPWDGIIVKERKSNGASSSERTAMG